MALELTTAPLSTLSEIRQTLGVVSLKEIYPNGTYEFINDQVSLFLDAQSYASGGIMDLKTLQMFSIIQTGNRNIHTLLHGEVLTELKNSGTKQALVIQNQKLSADGLSAFFVALPPKKDDGRTATINVSDNPVFTNSAYASVSAEIIQIAVDKGYTVVS
jgi:hypothetical protein